jgi:hypothetical protein
MIPSRPLNRRRRRTQHRGKTGTGFTGWLEGTSSAVFNPE